MQGFKPDGSVVLVGDLFDDSQTEAAAPRFAARNTVVGFEHSFSQFRGDHSAVIGDGQHDAIALLTDAHVDLARTRRVTGRIVEQIAN